MIKRSIHIIWALLGLLCGGCSDTLPYEDTEAWKEGLLPLDVKVSTDARAADGSQIVYPDGLIGEQHTSTVYIYVFEGVGPDASYTGYKADAGWSEYFSGGLPSHTAQMHYRLGYRFAEGGRYTLLGIAVNDAGREAFGIPLDFPVGSTPSGFIARLRELAPTAALHNAELYAGSKEIMINKNNPEVPVLEMKRRVAGVMACFKNVPDRIYVGEVQHPVTDIRISLYTAQNTALPVVARRQKPFFEDFITSPSAEPADRAQTLVKIPAGNLTPQTILQGGAYVLPAEAPRRGVYTLHVDLMDNDLRLKSIRVKLPTDDELNPGEPGGGTGIIDTESAFRFPLVANHFYALGTTSAPIDLKGNGSDITISIDPAWHEDNDLDINERP